MTSKKLRLALASAGICTFAMWPGAPGAGNDTFDPLLDGGPLCGPQSGGQPPILRALILAKAETAPFQPVPAQPAMGEAPVLYENLGTLTFKAGTSNRRAQAWFDQGVRLAFAFNHAEAQRAFREAQKLDPKCALCFWGEALILGPNINVPMMPEANPPALAALAKAVELEKGAPPRDRALIAALAQRYSSDPKAVRADLDAAYAKAMGDVAQRFPRDDTVQVLYAEALMDTQPWDYWEAGGAKPKGNGAAIVDTLEKVLEAQSAASGRHSSLHSCGGSVDASREGAAVRASARAADARRRSRRAHALAYLLSSRLVPRIAGDEPAGDGRRRALLQDFAVRPAVQVGVLPAQHPFPHGVGADGGRRQDRDRCRGKARCGDARRGRAAVCDPAAHQGGPLHDARAILRSPKRF